MPHLDEEQITALLDGELSPAEALQARDHLAGCAECAERFEEAKGFFDEADRLVRVLEFPEVAVPAKPAAPARLEAPPARRRFPLRQMAWAASLFLAIGLGYYGNELLLHPSRAAIETPAAEPAAAPTAGDQPTVLAETKSAAAPAQAKKPATEGARGKDGAPQRAGEMQLRGARDLANEQSLDKEKPQDERRASNAAAGAAGQVAAVPPVASAVSPAASEAPLVPRDADAAKAWERADSVPKPLKLADALQPSGGTLGQAARSGLSRREYAPAATTVTLEEAVQSLGGSIHLIDGLTPERVERLNGRAVPGAQPDLAIIRVVYLDAPMRELWLDQQRGKGVNATGDTVLLHGPDGGLSLQWPYGPDGWLSLTGHLTADSLRTLARLVR